MQRVVPDMLDSATHPTAHGLDDTDLGKKGGKILPIGAIATIPAAAQPSALYHREKVSALRVATI